MTLVRISCIEVKNFRAIRCARIRIDNLTIVLGPNGTGKTALLDAISVFFGKKGVDASDFHGGGDGPVEITVEFSDVGPEPPDGFPADRRICRRISKKDGKLAAEYLANVPRFQRFAELEDLKGNAYKAKYRAIRSEGYDLPECDSIEDMRAAIRRWALDHYRECEPVQERFVADPSAYVDIFPVEAMRDPSADASEGGGSALTDLVDLVIRSSPEESRKLAELDRHLRESFDELTDAEKFTGLSNMSSGITSIIREIEPAMEVEFGWRRDSSVRMPVPSAETRIWENGYLNSIDKSGHGAQRLFLYAILRYLHDLAHEAGAPGSGRMLIIDEPELHQHPVRQEAFYRVLKGLSDDLQVVYVTHSPNFL